MNTENKYTVSAAADGVLIPMNEIPDKAFASGSMGECFGILPDNGNVYAPVDGTVESVAETGHAVAIRTDDGKHILLHVGIDTVSLGKAAFNDLVKEGDRVSADQLILTADIDMIRGRGLSPMIIVIDMKC